MYNVVSMSLVKKINLLTGKSKHQECSTDQVKKRVNSMFFIGEFGIESVNRYNTCCQTFFLSTRFVDDIYCVSVQRKDRAGEWYNNRLYCGRGVRSPRYVGGGGPALFSVFEWIKGVFTKCSFKILIFF